MQSKRDLVLSKRHLQKKSQQWESIYHYLTSLPVRQGRIGVFGIVDNYKVWNRNGEARLHGKPFILSSSRTDRKSLFYDDNIGKKEIVRQIDLDEDSDEQSCYKGANMIRVNTVSAILDDDYFVNVSRSHIPQLRDE